jgi:hypothetical protein
MPAHYARHMSAVHGKRSSKAARKVSFGRIGRGPGRPKGSTTKRTSLAAMGLEDLLTLISDAKRLAKVRLVELSAAIR